MSTSRVNLLAFNVHGWRDGEWKINVKRVYDLINRLGVDVVALNEVCISLSPSLTINLSHHNLSHHKSLFLYVHATCLFLELTVTLLCSVMYECI